MRTTIYKVEMILQKATKLENIYVQENEKKLCSQAYQPRFFALILRGESWELGV